MVESTLVCIQVITSHTSTLWIPHPILLLLNATCGLSGQSDLPLFGGSNYEGMRNPNKSCATRKCDDVGKRKQSKKLIGLPQWCLLYTKVNRSEYIMTPRKDIENESSTGGVMAPMTDNYNQFNQSQSTVWQYAKPLFSKAMLDYRMSSDTFRVADLGCATGGNSVAPLSFVSSQLENGDCSLEIFLGDLPENAWSSVVSTVTPKSISGKNKDRASNTFVYMVGRSFYESCAPAESLDLSYSLVAVHWMKSYAGDIATGMYATDPLHNSDPTLLKAWRDAGSRDFAEFTHARHRELKLGGRFIGAVACPKETGDFPWSKVGYVIYQALVSKKANTDELASCVLPCCWRTEADVRAGFDNKRWELEACEFHETKDPVREALERGEISSQKYGQSVVESFKAVNHQTCIGALKTTMGHTDAEALLNEAYGESVAVIAKDPKQYNLDVSFWYVLAKKI